MNTQAETIRPEDLLLHAAWAQRLATVLVRDPARADDLVQEAFLAALRRPPRAGRPVRPWLAKVLRNSAREGARSEARRRGREEDRARGGDELPTPDQWAERLELQQALVDEVGRLDEDLRTTVLLRYYEGLSSAEIARRTETPAGTVRWRLKQGLDRLRVTLDERFGDRRSWCLALLPLVRKEKVAAGAAGVGSAAAATAGLALWAKVALALGVVAVLAVVWRYGLTSEPGEPPAPVLAADGPKPRAAEATPDETPEAPAALAAATRAPAAAAGPPEEAARPAAFDPTATLTVRFLDGEGRPVQGVRFEGSLSDNSIETSSGRDGAATLSSPLLDRDYEVSLRAEKAGFAQWSSTVAIGPGKTVELGDVVLEPGGGLYGRVVGPVGIGAAGATVLVHVASAVPDPERARTDGPPFGAFERRVETAAGGGYEVAGLAEGSYRLWARTAETAWSFSDPIPVSPGATVEVPELALAALALPRPVRVRVVAPDGQAVEDAMIGYRSGGMRGYGRRKDGTWTFDGVQRFTHFDVLVGYDPRGRFGIARLEDVHGSEDEVLLVLGPARHRGLAVVDAAGEPVEEYSATVELAELGAPFWTVDLGPRAGGRMELTVPEGREYAVRVEAPGHRAAETGTLAGTGGEPVTVALERLAPVSGRVADDGRPVAGVRVRLFRLHEENGMTRHNGFPCLTEAWAEATAISDADGRFELFVEEPGRFVLQADATADTVVSELGPIAVDPAVGAAGLELELAGGGRVEGELVFTSGRSPAGQVLGITRGDTRGRTVRADRDGRFAFDGLTPGGWYVYPREKEVVAGNTWSEPAWRASGWEHPSTCTVREGETEVVRLVVDDAKGGTLRGTLRIDGLDVAGWTASLAPLPGTDPFGLVGVTRATLAGDGTFEVETRGTGRMRLRVLGLGLMVDAVRLEELVEIAGDRTWEAAIPTGLLLEAGAVGDGLVHAWRGDGGLEVTTPLRRGAGGAARVPAGHGRIVRAADDWSRPSFEWELVREVDVAAGE